jgi:arylsulfatase A-like enzyme
MHAKPALLDRFAAVPDPNRRTYLATLASLDEAVGTVFAKLRNTGLEEDTLVFFLGDNLLPHLGGQNIHAPHEGLYWRFGSQMAVRQGPWKLVRASRGATEYSDVPVQPMLINLEQDVGERHDLAGENPALVRELQAAWDGWNTGNIAPRWPATVRGKPFLNP